MINLAGRLKNRVDVYGRIETLNLSGAKKFSYGYIKSVWADITPCLTNINVLGAKEKNYDGIHISYTAMKYKFLMRINALNVKKDMYFMYKGQRYDVLYSVPHFDDGGYMEVFAELFIENDDNTFEGVKEFGSY